MYFYVKKAHVGVIPGIEEYIATFTDEDAWGPYGYLADKGADPAPRCGSRGHAHAGHRVRSTLHVTGLITSL